MGIKSRAALKKFNSFFCLFRIRLKFKNFVNEKLQRIRSLPTILWDQTVQKSYGQRDTSSSLKLIFIPWKYAFQSKFNAQWTF